MACKLHVRPALAALGFTLSLSHCDPFEGTAPSDAGVAGPDGGAPVDAAVMLDASDPRDAGRRDNQRFVFVGPSLPGAFARSLDGGVFAPKDVAARICADDADNSPVLALRRRSWGAWISDSFGDAASRVPDRATYEWIAPSGKTIFALGDLAATGQAKPRAPFENRSGAEHRSFVWTGSTAGGGLDNDGRTCGNWTADAQFGTLGDPTRNEPGAWSAVNMAPRCSTAAYPFYCFEL